MFFKTLNIIEIFIMSSKNYLKFSCKFQKGLVKVLQHRYLENVVVPRCTRFVAY